MLPFIVWEIEKMRYILSMNHVFTTMTALYPGAGTDFTPCIMFPDIKHWVFTDSQPRSEFGNETYIGYSRPNFLSNLYQAAEQTNFRPDVPFCKKGWDHYVPHRVLTFSNDQTQQTVTYYTNNVFPEELPAITYATVVLIGFDSYDMWPPTLLDGVDRVILSSKCVEMNEEIRRMAPYISRFDTILMGNWPYWEHAQHTDAAIRRHCRVRTWWKLS